MMKALRMSCLVLVLTLLLVKPGGSAGAPAALGTWGPAGESAQGGVYHVATNGDWDWPQVQRDPQRTGYTPEVLGTDFQVAWTHPFYPEKVYPQVQAIVYAGNVYVGTEHGNMYALDAQTGQEQWVYPVGAPILASVAAADGKVFFGAMDGAVYALDVTSGSLVWKSQLSWRLGFSTAPVFAEDKVMLGSRNGIFYALDPDTGATLWQYDVGAPILQTAAWNNGHTFFGTMDMYVYALNTNDGSLAWQSARINGMAFKDYWPVVHQGKVLIRPMGGKFYALDEDTGIETITLPQFSGKTMNGATTPPAVDRDGYLIVPVSRIDGLYGCCWGRLNLTTQKVDEVLGGEGIQYGNGCGNCDENENVSSAQNLIIGLHVGDNSSVCSNGAYDLDNEAWTEIYGIDLQPAHNTQGGGGNPVSIANGMFYHISFHYLVARTAD